MRCLILDDESPARSELRQLLSLHPGIEVVGEAHDVESAMRLTSEHRPGLAFVDVMLRGESGFDYLARAGALLPHVVFVTAYDRYAVRGFECNALDYLLKPVDPERLAESLRRLHQRKPLPPHREDDRFFLQTAGVARLVPWRELLSIETHGNYTRLHFDDATSVVMLRTLKEWLTLAPEDMFIQVHRRLLVRRSGISRISFPAPKKAQALLVDGRLVPVGRSYLASLRAALGAP